MKHFDCNDQILINLLVSTVSSGISSVLEAKLSILIVDALLADCEYRL